jgi:hypothetical protein
MKRSFAILCLLTAAPLTFAQPANEKTEKRLAALLTPGGDSSASKVVSPPYEWKAPRVLGEIDLPIKPFAGAPARLPALPRREVKPGVLREGIPLVAFQDKTAVPTQVELPTKPLIRLPSMDIHAPLPIPILAQPAPDRAALGEPGFEASLDASLKTWTPTRDRPVPFQPFNLPDPFEHLRYAQLRNAPEENATPPVIPLQKPTK